jgi:RNA recognition motif-containing protein
MVSSAIAFAAGAVICGIALLFVKTTNSTEESVETNDLTTLYIGNLNYKVNENAIKAYFEQYGYVDSVRLMKDRKTGRRKGFGFVEVEADAADKMITKLNDSVFEERTLRVRLAKEKVED